MGDKKTLTPLCLGNSKMFYFPMPSELCSSRKYPYSPHRRDRNFLGCGGFYETKNWKKCMKLSWNFQRGGGGGVRKNPFCWGGMDIFWNYTLILTIDLPTLGTLELAALARNIWSLSSPQTQIYTWLSNQPIYNITFLWSSVCVWSWDTNLLEMKDS